MGGHCGCGEHVDPPAAARACLLHQYSASPRLLANRAVSYERVDYRVLFGPNLAGAAQRNTDRSDASAHSFLPKKCGSSRMVSGDLRDPLLWHHGVRRHSARRDRRSIGRALTVEIQFRVSARGGDGLVVGFVGLPVSAMRNRQNSPRKMDSILIKQVARKRT